LRNASRGAYRQPVNRWLIFLIVSGLAIGFAGVLAHNEPAIVLGVLVPGGGLFLAVNS
jgi:hypothetical protein